MVLEDGEIAVLTRSGVEIQRLSGEKVERPSQQIRGRRKPPKRAVIRISC